MFAFVFFVSSRMFNATSNILCHPELAAKSVETMSKRDFMPLPGVSGSYQLEMKTSSR